MAIDLERRSTADKGYSDSLYEVHFVPVTERAEYQEGPIANALKKYQNEQDDKLKQNTLKATLKRIESKLDATVAYTTEACRGEIKNMFYRYMDTKTLPYYEKMHMLQIEDIYVNKLQKNHYTKGLIDEMKTWSVDYTGVDSQDVN